MPAALYVRAALWYRQGMIRMKPLQMIGLAFAVGALVSLLSSENVKLTMSLMLIANVLSLLHWSREKRQ